MEVLCLSFPCALSFLSLSRQQSHQGCKADSDQAWRLRTGSSSGGAGLIKPWENMWSQLRFHPQKQRYQLNIYICISRLTQWWNHDSNTVKMPTRLIKHLPTHTHTRAATTIVSAFILVQSTTLCRFAACTMKTLTLLLYFQALSPSAVIIIEPYWDKWHKPT